MDYFSRVGRCHTYRSKKRVSLGLYPSFLPRSVSIFIVREICTFPLLSVFLTSLRHPQQSCELSAHERKFKVPISLLKKASRFSTNCFLEVVSQRFRHGWAITFTSMSIAPTGVEHRGIPVALTTARITCKRKV